MEKGSNFSGTILYNNKDVKDTEGFVRRIASYFPQIDRHHANLTVFENIQFAYNCTSMHHMDYSYAGLEVSFSFLFSFLFKRNVYEKPLVPLSIRLLEAVGWCCFLLVSRCLYFCIFFLLLSKGSKTKYRFGNNNAGTSVKPCC